MMETPFRYVLEGSHSRFFGDQRGALGFERLTSLGIGMELDTSARAKIITRARIIWRYLFGDNVRGNSVGLAVSF